jgi:membrane fusion protein, multidrug efflux system
METTENEDVLEDSSSKSVTEENNEEIKPEKKRPRTLIYVAGVLVFVILIGGFVWWLYSRQFVTTDDAFIEGNITVISPKISAPVTKVYVTENKYVKQGDLLLELAPQETENRLAQAKANLQTAIANKNKAEANALLTGVTGRAEINQAKSNLETSKNNIEQNRLVASSKESNIEQMRRQTITAEANLRQVQTQIKAANAEIDKAKAQVKSAQSKFDVARLEIDRDKKLFEDGVVSRQKLDQSNKELSQAEADLISAQKEVEITQSKHEAIQRQIDVETARLNESKNKIVSAENDYNQSLQQVDVVASQANESAGRLQESNSLSAQVAVGSSEIEIAAAQVTQAQAAVDQAEIELAYTKIFAPQDGYISHKAVQEGQIVQPEQSLMTITQGEIWVTANFKETQIEKMKSGQKVDVYVDAYPGVIFHGQIDSFQAGTGSRFSVLPSDNAGGNFVKVVQRIPVKITFSEKPDEKYLLVPGMSVVPKVRLK